MHQLRDLANAVRPKDIAFAIEEDSLPLNFVASASLQILEVQGGPVGAPPTTSFATKITRSSEAVASNVFLLMEASKSNTGSRQVRATEVLDGKPSIEFVRVATVNGMSRAVAEVEAEYTVSARVLESAGFGLVGSRKDAEDGLVGIWAAGGDA